MHNRRRRLASQHSSKAEAEIRFRRGGCSNRGLDAMKWKSHRRCAVSSPRTPITEVEKESNGKLFDCLDVKSKWNPRACTEQKKAGSLYICGCPGTGKSLSMEKVRQQTQDWAKQILGENETGKKAIASSSPLQQLQIMFSQKQQSPSSKMMIMMLLRMLRRKKGKEKDSEKEKGESLDVANFERLLQRLPGCVSRDLIDQLTGEYGQIHLIASLTSGLSRHHEEFAVAIVDEVLELNDYGAQQKRLAYLRFLGELYNYEHVDSSVIFETL
ncbi:hypothetical protein HID58_063180 [Brassica napus]|uniref:MIF4G domain-containing protein n=1 Tax=Brassica napus TaxID=3708 RepID=A0ABQ8A3I6_BRANA|nr:hypothetical protein HID58_063180 [Brassica napus]